MMQRQGLKEALIAEPGYALVEIPLSLHSIVRCRGLPLGIIGDQALYRLPYLRVPLFITETQNVLWHHGFSAHVTIDGVTLPVGGRHDVKVLEREAEDMRADGLKTRIHRHPSRAFGINAATLVAWSDDREPILAHAVHFPGEESVQLTVRHGVAWTTETKFPFLDDALAGGAL